MNKLVVQEFVVTEDCEINYTVKAGHTYSYFYDPETDTYYHPREGFTVTGDDLEKFFVPLVLEDSDKYEHIARAAH